MTSIAQDTSNCKPIIVSERPLKRGEIVRVHLELYRGRWALHVRKWYENDRDELCPGKGFSCGPEHLPWLGAALDDAIKMARENGLIPADQESGQ